ncbi:glycosyltransferase [Fontisphaera persica]|uniref:glycosyltransferase n=1 Tax=Fontisphaera persica TaxID=2974023 RepID=UPI0024BFEED9|nr:glycosyltransferase [Fontisphaera persica]WCJ60879.1 glycosyltransferase [Fontisphaera persica]
MSQPSLILHVVFSLEPGGMENGLVNVARRLDPQEFAVHVGCLERAGEFLRRLPPSIGVTVLGKRGGMSPVAMMKLRGLLHQLQPAVIHTHNLGPLFYTAMANGLGPKAPLLHGEHGMLTPREQRGWRYWLRRVLYPCCTAVHTVSETLLQYYQAQGFRHPRMISILNGVDAERFQPGDRAAARQAIGLPVQAVVLGMMGSFQRRKRHKEVLSAFQMIAGDFPHLHLLLVGARGPESEIISQAARSGPHGQRVHLHPYQEDPRPFYQAMDLLIVASENEGLSNAALEAMASGVPVLAGEACGNAEIITPGKNGWLARLDSAESIAQTLRQCLALPEALTNFGRQARETVMQRFRVEDMAARYAQLYRELARQGMPHQER